MCWTYPVFWGSNVPYILAMYHLDVNHPSCTNIFICRYVSYLLYGLTVISGPSAQYTSPLDLFKPPVMALHELNERKSPSAVIGDLAAYRQSLLAVVW